MNSKDTKALLYRLEACDDAAEWVGSHTLEWAWKHCKRGDWMVWLLTHRQMEHDDRELRLFACVAGESVLHLTRECDREVLTANIAVARRYAVGDATADELYAAWSAAYAARSAAWSAADAAWSAADAARSAADAASSAAYAADAAWSAADAASSAAYAARSASLSAASDAARSASRNAALSAASDAAWSAAWNAAWNAQADMVRQRFPIPPRPKKEVKP